MRKLYALIVSLAMLLSCTTALADAAPEGVRAELEVNPNNMF